MKKMTVFTAALTLSGLALTSCGDDKSNNYESPRAEMYSTDSVTRVEGETIKTTKKTNVIMSREYAMNDGTQIAYNINDDKVTGLADWNSFNILNNEISEIEETSFETTRERLVNLNGTIENLDESIPAWLKTEEVMEDVEDIQKEYRELINEKNASKNERRENVEEVSEQVDDLREELAETISEYIEIHKDAIEEYNEEINDGDSIEDANEEFYEEMKKADKIADYKEKK